MLFFFRPMRKEKENHYCLVKEFISVERFARFFFLFMKNCFYNSNRSPSAKRIMWKSPVSFISKKRKKHDNLPSARFVFNYSQLFQMICEWLHSCFCSFHLFFFVFFLREVLIMK